MSSMVEFDVSVATDGSGFWSKTVATTKLHSLMLTGVGYYKGCKLFGELRARFNPASWDINNNGLVYTDEKWIRQFRRRLRKAGFSKKGVKDVTYSEPGMQGNNYVSLDVGEMFINEWLVVNNLTLTDIVDFTDRPNILNKR